MKKQFILSGLVGIGMGNIISMLIALIISLSTNSDTMTVMDYVKYTIASSVIGFIFAGASSLFDNDKISMLKATIIHFLCLIVTFLPFLQVGLILKFMIY